MKRVLAAIVLSVLMVSMGAVTALAEQKPGWVESLSTAKTRLYEQRPGWVTTHSENGTIWPW
ncbi:MAG TPA: hypothetical protein VD973_21655 [Symbiobacteriaceae bacterium]|nr:hypothetical protein [Symbiobacteriaceae bacterium]